jgi:DNA polymerase-1
MFVIIDVFNLIYRALGVVSTKKFEEKGYLYGDINKSFLQVFFKMVNRIYRNFKGSEIFIAWEGEGKNFRYDLYPDYKANRNNKLKDLIDEKYYDVIKDNLIYYGFRILEETNSEADDIIFNFCDLNRDKEIIVISGDTDFIQLLQKFEKVKFFSVAKDEYINKTEYDYVLFKSIKGDTSDNIKGLFGYGEKKAEVVTRNYETFSKGLSEESRIIIARNMKLIDLSKNPDNDKIKEVIKKQLDAEKEEFNITKIANFYLKWQLKDLYKNINSELMSFF